MNAPLLQLQQVSKTYGPARAPTVAVADVSLQLHSGRNLALVGESGSGKTVTALGVLRLLGSAQLSGQCWFDGEDLMQALSLIHI